MTRSIRFPQGADPTKRPEWLKVRLQTNERAKDLAEVIERLDLNTLCAEAKCPNIGESWGVGTATIMILGDTCTRMLLLCGGDVQTSSTHSSHEHRQGGPLHELRSRGDHVDDRVTSKRRGSAAATIGRFISAPIPPSRS